MGPSCDGVSRSTRFYKVQRPASCAILAGAEVMSGFNADGWMNGRGGRLRVFIGMATVCVPRCGRALEMPCRDSVSGDFGLAMSILAYV